MTLRARRAGLHSRMRHYYGRNDGRPGVFLTDFSSNQVPARCKRMLPSHLIRRARHVQQPVRALEIAVMVKFTPQGRALLYSQVIRPLSLSEVNL